MKIKFLFIPFLLGAIFCNAQEKNLDWPNLKKYESANAELTTPVKNRVVFMGNSITEGWIHTDSAFFASHNYIDRGISGQTTPQMLLRFRPDVINLKPAVVVILAGINDIAENTGPATLETIFGNIVSMAELAKANKIKPVICSVLPASAFPWKPEINPVEKVKALNKMLAGYCKKEKIVYVDYYTKMVNKEFGLSKDLAEDGVHPTLKGYKIMEEILQPKIDSALFAK